MLPSIAYFIFLSGSKEANQKKNDDFIRQYHLFLYNIPTSKSWAIINIAINFAVIVTRTSSNKYIISLVDMHNNSASYTADH